MNNIFPILFIILVIILVLLLVTAFARKSKNDKNQLIFGGELLKNLYSGGEIPRSLLKTDINTKFRDIILSIKSDQYGEVYQFFDPELNDSTEKMTKLKVKQFSLLQKLSDQVAIEYLGQIYYIPIQDESPYILNDIIEQYKDLLYYDNKLKLVRPEKSSNKELLFIKDLLRKLDEDKQAFLEQDIVHDFSGLIIVDELYQKIVQLLNNVELYNNNNPNTIEKINTLLKLLNESFTLKINGNYYSLYADTYSVAKELKKLLDILTQYSTQIEIINTSDVPSSDEIYNISEIATHLSMTDFSTDLSADFSTDFSTSAPASASSGKNPYSKFQSFYDEETSSTLEELRSEILKLQLHSEEIDVRYKSAQIDLKFKDKEIGILKEKVQELETKIQEQLLKIESIETENTGNLLFLQELENEKQKLLKCNDSLIEMKKKFDIEREQFETQIYQFKGRQLESDIEIHTLTEDNRNLTDQIQEIKEQLKEQVSNLARTESLELKLALSSKELENLEKQLKACKETQMLTFKKIKSFEQQLKEKNEELIDADIKSKSKDDKYALLTSMYKSEKDFLTLEKLKYTNSQKDLLAATSALTELTFITGVANQELKKAQVEQIGTLKKDYELRINQITTDMQQKLELIRNQLTNEKYKNMQLTNEKNELTSENTELTKKNTEQLLRFQERLLSVNQQLEKSISNYELCFEEGNKIKQEIAELKLTVFLLRSNEKENNTKHKKEIIALELKKLKLNTDLELCRDTNRKLLLDIEELKTEFDSLNERFQKSKEKHRLLKTRNTELTDITKELEKQLVISSNRIELLGNNLEQITSELDQNKIHLQEITNELQQTKNELQQTHELLNTCDEHYRSYSEQKDEEFINLEERYDELVKETQYKPYNQDNGIVQPSYSTQLAQMAAGKTLKILNRNEMNQIKSKGHL